MKVFLDNEVFVALYSDLTAKIVEALYRGTTVNPWKSDGGGGECYTEEAQNVFNKESDDVCRLLADAGIFQSLN